AYAQLQGDQDRQAVEGQRGQSDVLAAGPPPRRPLGQREQKVDEYDGEQQRTDDVEATGEPLGGFVEGQRDGDEEERADQRGGPEQRGPSERAVEHTGQRQRQSGADAKGGAHQGEDR